MKQYIISIGRQFGCGAHETAVKLSQRLGIPYYDKEIIKRAAKESGFDESIFAFYDEKPTRSFLYNISTDGFSSIANASMTLEDKVFQYQFDSIRSHAQQGSCIIVGRCADYILRDMPNLVTIFLHADEAFRCSRIVDTYGLSRKDALKEMKNVDKKRARFHNFYSDYKWGDAATYDLSINVSKLGIDAAVDMIEKYINTRFS